jgi:lambda family phage tail tape measure protein
MANLGALVVSLEANMARFQSDMGKSAQVTEQAMQKMDASSARAQQALKRLDSSVIVVKNSIAGLAAVASIGAFKNLSDSASTVEGKIRLVTDSYKELKSVQSDLLGVSQKTRQSFESTVDLYSKVYRASEDLNLSQKDMIKFTGAVNNAMVVSAAGAQQSEAAILQLGQAMASGKLAGDEFKSISENAPRLIQAIANGMGVARGQMKQLATDGKLTAEVITQAVIGQFATLEAEAAKMPVTIGQSFQQLRNVMVNYMTGINESSGVTQAVSSAVGAFANNIKTLEAAVAGLVSYKVAGWMIEISAAMAMKANAAYAAAGALSTERFATIAAAEANVLKTRADIAAAEIKIANIAATRAEAVATLASANATAIATSAVGAYSTALAMNRAALQSRSVALAELAVLGRTQVAAEAAMAAANVSAAAATTALTTAKVAGAGAAGLASRAIGLLGGPIGAVATVLGLGVTAWQLWGNAAKDSETKAATAVGNSTQDILDNLDKQIAKLEKRNQLAQMGIQSSDSDSPEKQRQNAIALEIKAAQAGTGEYAGLNEVARIEHSRRLGAEYGELAGKMAKASKLMAQDEKRTQGEKLGKWMIDYANKSEQMRAELDKARKDLGSAFTPELEERIREKFTEKPNKSIAKNEIARVKKDYDDQLHTVENALQKEQDAIQFNTQYIAEQRNQDLVDLQTYNDYRQRAIDANLSAIKRASDAEIVILEEARDGAAKPQDAQGYQNKINDQIARQAKAEQDAGQASKMLKLDLSDAQSELNKTTKEWVIQQELAVGQFQFEIDMLGKSAIEVAKLTAARRIQLQVEEEIRRAQDKSSTPIDRTEFDKRASQAISKSNALYDQADAKDKDPWFNMQESIRRYGEEANNVGAQIGSGMTNAFKSAEDAFVQFTMTGKLSFADLARSVIADIARIQARKAIAGMIEMAIGAFSGSSGGGSAGAESSASSTTSAWSASVGGGTGFKARAAGGPVWTGESFLVGEQGPEIFTPQRSGTIIPNGALGGSGGSVMVNVSVDASGTSTEGNDQQGRQLGAMIGNAVRGVILQEKRPGGMLA